MDRALPVGTGVVGLRQAVTARNDPSGTVSMVPFVGINAPLASSRPLHFHPAEAAAVAAVLPLPPPLRGETSLGLGPWKLDSLPVKHARTYIYWSIAYYNYPGALQETLGKTLVARRSIDRKINRVSDMVTLLETASVNSTKLLTKLIKYYP